MKPTGVIQQGATNLPHAKVHAADFMIFWLETDLKKRTDSHETYYNYCGIVKNHIIPILGKKKMIDVIRGDVQKLFDTKAGYSRPIAELVKTIMNVSFRYAVTNKVIQTSPVDGIGLPKTEKPQQRSGFRIRTISVVPTLAGQGAKDSIADIISSFLLKMACRTSAGMIFAAHTVRSC